MGRPQSNQELPQSAAQGIVIHNTENPNRAPATGTAEEQIAFKICRGIQIHHMDGNGWSDTGQHFTVSRGGLILEGRTGALATAKSGKVVQGAHASGVSKYNNKWLASSWRDSTLRNMRSLISNGMHWWNVCMALVLGKDR
jgi:hypothetical protein